MTVHSMPSGFLSQVHQFRRGLISSHRPSSQPEPKPESWLLSPQVPLPSGLCVQKRCEVLEHACPSQNLGDLDTCTAISPDEETQQCLRRPILLPY